VALDGRVLSDEADAGTVALDPELRWQQLAAGTYPTGPGQALVDAHAAEQFGVRIGDRLRVGRGPDAVQVRVTGSTETSSGPLGSPLYLTYPDLRRAGEVVVVDNVAIDCDDCAGTPVDALREVLPERYLVQPATAYLQMMQTEATQGVDVISLVLLVFAAIAFFVSALVIANTFSILLAQRARDFALLRCVGATRRQVLRSVRTEALVVGVGSATLGVAAGVGLGYGLAAVAGLVWPGLPLGAVSFPLAWVGGGWLTGLLVTVGAGLLPARRATRVSPLAALRPADVGGVRTRTGWVRLAGGAVLLLIGGALLVLAMSSHQLAVMLAGGMVSYLGVLAWGPLLFPALVRLVGQVVRRLGVPGALATGNALRNPRRTAATAGSLLVGVTLVSGLLVGVATARGTVTTAMDEEYPVDAALTAPVTPGSDVPLGAETVREVRAIDGVAQAQALPGTTLALRLPAAGKGEGAGAGTGTGAGTGAGTVLSGRQPVLGVDPAALRHLVHGRPDFVRPRADTLFLPWEVMAGYGLDIGAEVVLGRGPDARTLTVAGAEGFGNTGLVARETLRALTVGADVTTRAVWVRAAAGADAADLRGALSTVAAGAGAELSGGLENRAFVDLQLDVLTGATLALLATGVVIALIGIGNTLGLSVLERGREHALLRALGLTRGGLRATLAAESVLLAVVAGLLGVALGTGYAWIGVRTMMVDVIEDTRLVLPGEQLLAVVGAAAVAGLLACVLPARKAARVTPAQGLSAE
jgi:putative ABC transport system permease protein